MCIWGASAAKLTRKINSLLDAFWIFFLCTFIRMKPYTLMHVDGCWLLCDVCLRRINNAWHAGTLLHLEILSIKSFFFLSGCSDEIFKKVFLLLFASSFSRIFSFHIRGANKKILCTWAFPQYPPHPTSLSREKKGWGRRKSERRLNTLFPTPHTHWFPPLSRQGKIKYGGRKR